MMTLSDFALAVKTGQLADVDIITHSGLGRYGVQVRLTGSEYQELLKDSSGQPIFWRSLDSARLRLRRMGYRWRVGLVVRVPQDEVIGRW